MRTGHWAVLLGIQLFLAGFFCDLEARSEQASFTSLAAVAASHSHHAAANDSDCEDSPGEPLWQRAGDTSPTLIATTAFVGSPVSRPRADAAFAGRASSAVLGSQAARAAPSLTLLSRLLI